MPVARRLLALLPAFFLFAASVTPVAAVTPAKDPLPRFAAVTPREVGGRFIAFVDRGTSVRAITTIATTKVRAAGGSIRAARGATWFAFAATDAVAAKIAALPGVARVARDLKVKATDWPVTTQTPDDTGYEQLWGLADMNVESAWVHTRGAGVTVAVIDTGIKASHPDLATASFANGYDVVTGMALPVSQKAYWPESPMIPHGTHVAGTIAAVANNEMGIAGVAPEATLMPVRVLSSDGGGTIADVTYGIEWAATHGADVINLSIGGTFYASEYEMLIAVMGPTIDAAVDGGTVVVAASGNDSLDEEDEGATTWPADHPRVIRVGAHGVESFVDEDDMDEDGDTTETLTLRSVAGFSNAADTVAVTAPGVSVLSTEANSGWYEKWDGTSMATPHVAGLVALIRAENPSLTPVKIKALITSTADDSDKMGGSMGYTAGRDDASGAGAIDADAVFDVLVGGGRVVGIELAEAGRDVLVAGGRIVPVRTTAFGGASTCTLQVRVYNPDGVRRGVTGVLSGTRCGLRSIGYAAVMSATGTTVPNNTFGWTVSVIASNGAAKATMTMPVVGADTSRPTISAIDTGDWPASLPLMTVPSFSAEVTMHDDFVRSAQDVTIDASMTVVFSGGQTRTYPSVNAMLTEMWGETKKLTDVYGMSSSVSDGVMDATMTFSGDTLRGLAAAAQVVQTARDCGSDADDCLWSTVDPSLLKLRLKVSDGTHAVSGPLMTIRLLTEADWSLAAEGPEGPSWFDASDESVGAMAMAGCSPADDPEDGMWEACGTDVETTGGALADDWLATETAGATYTITGRGGRLLLYGSVGPAFGAFTVSVDGTVIATVNLAKNPVTGAPVTEISNGVLLLNRTFGAGQHTIVLTTKNAKLVGLDAFSFGPR